MMIRTSGALRWTLTVVLLTGLLLTACWLATACKKTTAGSGAVVGSSGPTAANPVPPPDQKAMVQKLSGMKAPMSSAMPSAEQKAMVQKMTGAKTGQ